MGRAGKINRCTGALIDASEIRIRAERRLGEMIVVQKDTAGLNTGARGIGTSAVPKENRTPTLADAGIDKKLSSRAQQYAAIPSKKFESILADRRPSNRLLKPAGQFL